LVAEHAQPLARADEPKLGKLVVLVGVTAAVDLMNDHVRPEPLEDGSEVADAQAEKTASA
jgi:hypothetical protein